MTDVQRDRTRDASAFFAVGTGAVGAVAAAARVVGAHSMMLVVGGVVAASALGVYIAARRRRVVASRTDTRLADQVAALMRAGGWRQVTVTAAMGRFGTDVVGVASDGRRWVMRCHRDAARLDPSDVHGFADASRSFRRADVTMLVATGAAPAPVLNAMQQAGVTLVDTDALMWWAERQNQRTVT